MRGLRQNGFHFSRLPSSLTKALLLSQCHQREPRGVWQVRPMPGSGSVPFFSRAKVPRYLPRGQPGASSATGKGHPCPELGLLWWLGRDSQPQPAGTKHAPQTAGGDCQGHQEAQERTSAGTHSLVTLNGSRGRTRKSLGATLCAV